MFTNKKKYKIKYFFASWENEADKEANAKLTESIYHEFKIVVSNIGYSEVNVLTASQWMK